MLFERPFRLHLIHFNDLHGRLADISPDEVQPVFSRIAGFIRRSRAAAQARRDEGVLVLSGGDDLIGSPFAELAGVRPEQFSRHPAYHLYSAVGIDAAGIGNHDLDWGLRMLTLAAREDATFPLLSANLIRAPWAESSAIRPYSIFPVKGLRVGVIGLTTPGEIKQTLAGEFEIADPLATLRDLLPVVRAQSDIVVVLSHLGRSAADPTAVVQGIGDIELAAALPTGAVQVIVGSHTHSVLNEHGLDPANMVNGIAIAQAGSHGRHVGEVVIDITAVDLQVVDARLYPVAALPEACDFEEEHVAPIARRVLEIAAEPLGVTTPHEDLDWVHVREKFASGESALANFVADAVAARCRVAGLPVDFALVDSSSVADGLPQRNGVKSKDAFRPQLERRPSQNEPLTFGDLFKLAPYGDSIVLFRLPADQLQALLDDNVWRADVPGEQHEERGFVHFSREVRYRITSRAPAERLAGNSGSAVDAEKFRRVRTTLRATQVTLGGVPLEQVILTRETPLLVAGTSFLRQLAARWERRAAGQGQVLFDLNAQPHEVTALALREELVAYVRQMGGVTEAAGLVRDGRVLSA